MKQKHIMNFPVFLLILVILIVLGGCFDLDDKGKINILININITQEPYKKTYLANETFDPAGLIVTAYYWDDSTKQVPASDYSLSTPDMSTSGTKTITVTFQGKTVSFSITVNTAPQGVYLTSITVTKPPTKITYNVNETFNSAGLVVTANKSDGTSEQVNGYTLSTPNMSSAGTKTITVTYQSKTATFNITVIAAAPEEGNEGDVGNLGVIIN